MKRKGFTLIELLSVIVILAVITLITVPMITNVIEESKKKALVSSIQGLVESANLYAIENDGVYEFLFDKEHQGSTKKGESLDYRGAIDGEGKLYLDKEGSVSVCISNDTYYVYKNYNSGIIVGNRSKDNCNIEYDALTNKYVAFLESKGNGSNVYSKDEVNNLVDAKATELNNKITNNTNEITNMKSNIEELQNNLNNYVLQSELDKTNTNVENLSSLVNNSAEIKNYVNGTDFIINDSVLTSYQTMYIQKLGNQIFLYIQGALEEHNQYSKYKVGTIKNKELIPTRNHYLVGIMQSGAGGIGQAEVIIETNGEISIIPFQSDCNWIFSDVGYLLK